MVAVTRGRLEDHFDYSDASSCKLSGAEVIDHARRTAR